MLVTAVEAAAGHVRRIASAPRPAGGENEARARRHCADVLRDLGFDVSEEPFTYSAWVGRYATPLGGASAVIALLLAARVGAEGSGTDALIVLATSFAILAGVGFLLARRGVTSFPLSRREGINLVATRGEPRVWLVAHLDSKSQPVPILVRAGGIALTGVVLLIAILVAAAQASGVEASAAWPWLAVAGAIAALPIVASTVGAKSPGALDNASGVATVLLAAEAVPRTLPLGVLLPSAEELGLAGARSWVKGRRPLVAINCDGVDDAGAFTCMFTARRPRRLMAIVRRAAERAGTPLRFRRLLPGVLTDAVALADAGWDAVTLSKGSLRTLSHIHRPGDSAEALRGDGIAETARVIAFAVEELA